MTIQQTQELAHWRGSMHTADAVRKEIARRYGEDEAKNYDPTKNCFTFKTWLSKGYVVKKHEKAIRSMTLVEVKDENAGDGKDAEIKRYPKTVYLFYIKQVKRK